MWLSPLIVGFSGCWKVYFCVQALAQHRAHLHQLAGGEIRHVAIARLRLDDGVEVAAIGDVDLERADARALRPRSPLECRKAGTLVRRTDSTYSPSWLYSAIDEAGRRLEPQHARRLRPHQPVLDRHRHGADGAVAAHRQAAGGLDEQDADVAIRPRSADRGCEPDIMSWPRGSNIRPVRIQSNSARKCWRRSLMLAPLSCGPPPDHHAHRIAAGMGVDAAEGEFGHRRSRSGRYYRALAAVICPNWIQYATLRVSSGQSSARRGSPSAASRWWSAPAARRGASLRKRLTCFTRMKTAKATIRKLMHGVDEDAVVDRRRLRHPCAAFRDGYSSPLQHQEEVGEIDAVHDVADRRHDDVLDQRVDHRGEGRADDDADGKVDDVAAHRESPGILSAWRPPVVVSHATVWWVSRPIASVLSRLSPHLDGAAGKRPW